MCTGSDLSKLFTPYEWSENDVILRNVSGVSSVENRKMYNTKSMRHHAYSIVSLSLTAKSKNG